jgi:hypothetical protein
MVVLEKVPKKPISAIYYDGEKNVELHQTLLGRNRK